VSTHVNYLLLSTAFLGTIFSATATRIVSISMPTIAQSLGTDLIGISWALLSYQLSNIGLSIVFGRLADLLGREKVFGLGFLVFSLSSLLCGLSQTIIHLILARFLQGVGGAMLQSSSRALAAESVPEDLAGRVQGYMTTAYHVGFILGPSIGGFMIDYFSWRWSFFFLVPIGLGGTLLALANLKSRAGSSRHPSTSIDYAGAALLVATTSTLVLLLDRRTHELIDTPAKILLGMVFVACVAILIVHESRAKNPFVRVDLFRIRRFSLSVLSLLLIAVTYSLIGFLLPFYLQDILGFSPTAVGLFFMAPSLATVAVAPFGGHLSDRLGPRLPAAYGAGVSVIALGVGWLLRVDSTMFLPALLIGMSAVTNGLFNPANSVSMIGMMPQEHRGFASAMNHVAFGMGNVLGVAIGGFIMALAFEYHTGVTGVSPTTDNPAAFVAALNVTFVAGAAMSALAVVTSLAQSDRRP
jgi:EmrB/QacA subfamily drug resistance transporter